MYSILVCIILVYVILSLGRVDERVGLIGKETSDGTLVATRAFSHTLSFVFPVEVRCCIFVSRCLARSARCKTMSHLARNARCNTMSHLTTAGCRVQPRRDTCKVQLICTLCLWIYLSSRREYALDS